MSERQTNETPAATGASLKQIAGAGATRREQYIPRRVSVQQGERQVIDAFLEAMADVGIKPVFTRGSIEADGKMVRFHVQGDRKGTRNGFAILFGDGIPAGSFGTWKDGATHTWCAKGHNELTDDEREQINSRMAQAKAEREREEKERQGEAARMANLLWQESSPADDSHPYLLRKGVRSYGLRVSTWSKCNDDGEEWLRIPNALLVPVMLTSGKIVSLQAIFPSKENQMGRDKDFMPGGRKRGGFYLIGTPPREGGNIVVCEGYATGASIHDATGWCVAVAFDAGNMVAVAEDLRALMLGVNFVVAADNDRWSRIGEIENPGVHFAERAAHAVRGRVVAPEFADLDGRPTDWNDLHQREGIDVVQRQLMPVTTAVVVDQEGNDQLPNFDPRAVDGYTPFPEIDGKGRPLATIENVAELMRRANITVRYNVISKDLEINFPGSLAVCADNVRNSAMSRILSLCATTGFPAANVERFVATVASERPYNPVATWIESKPWDGVERFDDLVATIKLRVGFDQQWAMLLLRKWLISAVAAAYVPEGFSSRGVLVFQGPQASGKTTWFKRLVDFRQKDLIREGLIIDPRNTDDVLRATSCWLGELGELDATFRKADIAALKGFISRSEDVYRKPYAAQAEQIQRRTVFFASVNDEQFLHDPTGNARWWTLPVERLDINHAIDTQQLWAEVLTWFRAEYREGPGLRPWDLSATELTRLSNSNDTFTATDPIADAIRSLCGDQVQDVGRWLNAREVLAAVGYDKATRAQANEAVRVLCDLELPQRIRHKVRQWQVPGVSAF